MSAFTRQEIEAAIQQKDVFAHVRLMMRAGGPALEATGDRLAKALSAELCSRHGDDDPAHDDYWEYVTEQIAKDFNPTTLLEDAAFEAAARGDYTHQLVQSIVTHVYECGIDTESNWVQDMREAAMEAAAEARAEDRWLFGAY